MAETQQANERSVETLQQRRREVVAALDKPGPVGRLMQELKDIDAELQARNTPAKPVQPDQQASG